MRRWIRETIDIMFWRLLLKSRVFKYGYAKFLNTLLFELERFDIDGSDTIKKYKNKLQEVKSRKY